MDRTDIKDMEKQIDMMRRKLERVMFLRNLLVLSITAILTVIYINRTGAYPWGSDTYGHLFKGNILYDSIKNGKLFLKYDERWYNGVQPFRYWAPFPYYILALINLITNNIFTTYNVFVAFVFILGGLGWLCFGGYIKRQNLGLVFALLWFFVPNNLRILFSEGNIPFVLVNSLIPFVFFFYYKTQKDKRVINYIVLALFMCIITLTHAMLSAMAGLSFFMLVLLDSVITRRYVRNVAALLYAFLGVMLSSFWLYPALKGGIMSMDSSSVAGVMRGLTYSFNTSLNPLLRFSSIEVYYFGLSFCIAAVFGLLMSTKNERAPFAVSLLILLGTTKLALPVLEKLPMNQLFWMSRFTGISMAMIIMGIFIWKNLRKSILVVLVLLMAADSAASFYILGFNRKFPDDQAKIFDIASLVSTQRIAVLDDSYFGSFPSYYIGYNPSGRVKNQVYGWAWQGASTSKNIVMLNTALENGYYDFMFDRALELGADTLIVMKQLVGDFNELDKSASGVGYEKYWENSSTIIYKYPYNGIFGTKTTYDGIVIGKYASNLIYIFPKLQQGESNYLDDYTFDELKNMKTVYLSGFKYRNEKAAEELILRLSESGVRIVVDMIGIEGSFMGVRSEPITISGGYGDIYYKNTKLQLKKFPEEYRQWRTSFISGIDDKENYEIINHRLISYIGKKHNNNLVFIGLNIPYYAFLTRDMNAVKILEGSLGLKAFEVPKREIHPVYIKRQDDVLNIRSDSEGVTVPIAALDAFVRMKGDYSAADNLLYLKTPEVEIKIVYPFMRQGIALSLISFAAATVLSIFLMIENIMDDKRRERRRRRRQRENLCTE